MIPSLHPSHPIRTHIYTHVKWILLRKREKEKKKSQHKLPLLLLVGDMKSPRHHDMHTVIIQRRPVLGHAATQTLLALALTVGREIPPGNRRIPPRRRPLRRPRRRPRRRSPRRRRRRLDGEVVLVFDHLVGAARFDVRGQVVHVQLAAAGPTTALERAAGGGGLRAVGAARVGRWTVLGGTGREAEAAGGEVEKWAEGRERAGGYG